MATLCSVTDVTDELPEGASTTISASTALVTRLIEVVESAIVSKTRRDWVNDYASVNSANQGLLKETCVAGTCFKIINADTTGFFSRQAAEIALDVFTDTFKTNIKVLQDIDTTNVRSID